ncbi:MAG: hypothetical protein VB048_04030 [Bacteroidaceae bacterium]|nr:hypothetical protein [Bacteroidaceae bacterium]
MKPFIGKIQDTKGITLIIYPAFLLYTVKVVILAKFYSLFSVLIAVGQIFASSMVGVIGYESMFLIYAMILIVSLVLRFTHNQYKTRKVI